MHCYLLIFRKFLLLAVAFQFLTGVTAFPQTRTGEDSLRSAVVLGLRGHYGFIIPHSASIRSISYSKPWALEADIAWQLTRMRAWQQCNCYPRLGITTTYVNFDNPAVLGSGFTSLAYAEPFFSVHRRLNLSFRMGGGLVYLNQVYDPVSNPDNLFYSTPFSFILQASMSVNVPLNEKTAIRLSGNYNHISNGGTKLPNKGINFPTLSLGLDYTVRPAQFPVRTKTRWRSEETKLNRLSIALLGTAKTINEQEPQRYLTVGLMTSASRQIGRISALALGAEWIADGTLREEIQRQGLNRDHNRVALLAGHELLVGRFNFSQHLGVYIYAPQKAMDPVYQRYGLSYRFTDHLFLGINLKAHRQVADLMDVRLGYIF